MTKIIKKILKKAISPVALKNLRGFIAAKPYYMDYLFGKGRITALREVCIEITFKCNCRCLMCPLYGVHVNEGKDLVESIKTDNELTVDEFRELFNGLKRLGTQSVNFSGGEVFLRKDLFEITAMAKEAGMSVSYTTNGGLISQELARKVVEAEVDDINISLDGPKDVHEHVRKAKIFDKIMNAVDWITAEKERQNKKCPELNFLCTISRLNQSHLVELADIARSKGLLLTLDPIIFSNEEDEKTTKSNFQDGFIKKESFNIPDEISDIDVDALEGEFNDLRIRAKELGQPIYISIAGKKTRNKFFKDRDYSIVNKCFAPWYSCRIDPSGNVYPCSLSIAMGNLRKNNIEEIINGEKAVNFRNKLKKQGLFKLCKKCCVLYSQNKFWNYLPRIGK